MKKIFTFLISLFIVGFAFGQTTIKIQDFDSGTPVWNYTSTPGDGTIATTSSRKADGTYSLEFTGSNKKNSDPYVVFDNVSISNYSSVTLEIAFSADGPDNDDDLYLDISYDNGSTWNGSGSVKLVDGYSNANVAFGATNSSNPTTVSSNPWSVSISDSETQIKIRIRFDERSNKNNTSDHYFVDAIKLKGTASGSSNSNESIIEKKSGWSEPTNIDYTSYSASSGLTTGNSIEVASYTIKDGGSDGTDADATTTKLTDISFTVANYQDLAALAIFDGTTNAAEVTSFSSTTVSFSSLTLEAADEGTKDFTLRATYKSKVTDNDNLKFTVSSATADGGGSDFAASDAGGATTDDTGNNNKLVVTADRLAFTTNKPPSSVDNSSNFDVEVEATDAGGSRDLDATNSITLAKASGTGTLSSATGLTQSLSSGVYLWTDVQYDTDEDFTIEAQTASLTNKTSGTITCSTPTPIPDLIISEVADPKDDYTARFVELYNGSGSSIDFSSETFYLYEQANGGNFNGVQLTGTLAAGAMYVVAYNASDFNSAYGKSADLASGNINGNGDDGYFLYYGGDNTSGTLVDQYGVKDEDGTGKTWEYTDSRVVRDTSAQKSNSKAAHAWSINEWTITNNANVADMTPGNKDAGQTLPISLISFTYKQGDNVVILNWQTATEENNDYFVVERSYNANDFENIGEVKAAGNSNEIQYYKLVDKTVDLSQTIYYRLKQVDYNGKYTYSEVIAVNASSDFKLLRSYNIDNNIYFEINSGLELNASLRIMDISGRVLLNQDIDIQQGINTYRVSLADYSTGLYFISIGNGNTNINAKIILK